MGLINQVQSPLLKQAEGIVEKGVQPKFMDAYKRVVVAGMKVMFDKKTHKMMIEGLEDEPDPITTGVRGLIGILSILYKQSRGTMPMEAMIPAGLTLMIIGLDFMDKTGIVKVGKEELGKATQEYLNELLPKIGLTPEKMNTLMTNVQNADVNKLKGMQNGAA